MNTPRLVAVTAGLTQPSSSRLLTDRLTAATRDVLRDAGAPPDVEIVELRDHARDITNAMLASVPTGGLSAVLDSVTRADGLIVVTPVFNASYSGLFKSFFDVLEPDTLTGTPVLLGATGGTPRHSLVVEHAMRPMFVYLRAVTVPTAVYAAAEDWGTSQGADPLRRRVRRAAEELAALVLRRSGSGRPDPFDQPTPFDQLLSG